MAEARRASRSLGDAHLLGGEVAALEELEDDGALEEGIVGEIDDSAAAGADLADELVLLDLASLHEFIIARIGVGKVKDWQELRRCGALMGMPRIRDELRDPGRGVMPLSGIEDLVRPSCGGEPYQQVRGCRFEERESCWLRNGRGDSGGIKTDETLLVVLRAVPVLSVGRGDPVELADERVGDASGKKSEVSLLIVEDAALRASVGSVVEAEVSTIFDLPDGSLKASLLIGSCRLDVEDEPSNLGRIIDGRVIDDAVGGKAGAALVAWADGIEEVDAIDIRQANVADFRVGIVSAGDGFGYGLGVGLIRLVMVIFIDSPPFPRTRVSA